MTIKQALIKGVTVLKLEKISTPKLKARLLLQYVLKKPRQYLIVYDNQKLTDKEEQDYLKYIELLTQGEPIEHITHQKEFMKLNFYVDENVLIPRQDTEVLVEEVMNIAKKIRAKKNIRFMHREWSNCSIFSKIFRKCAVNSFRY